MMQRDILSTGPFGHAKRCVIDTFDTNYLMSAIEVMANIPYVSQNMDKEPPDSYPKAVVVGPVSIRAHPRPRY
jgi:hypothetical protein